MTAQLPELPSKERLEKIVSWRETYGDDHNVVLPAEEAEALARYAMAGMEQEPVGLFYEAEQGNWYQQSPGDKAPKWTPLYAAPVVSEQSAYKAAIATLEHLGYIYHGGEMWKPPLGPAPNFSLIDQLHAEIDALKEQLGSYPALVAVPDEQHSERFDWSYEDWANHLGGRHQNNDPACYYEFGSLMAVAEMLRQFGNVQRKVGWNACRAAIRNHSGDTTEKASPAIPAGWRLGPIEPTEVQHFRESENSSTENFRKNSETSTKCWCRTCRPVTLNDMRFVVCPDCGNKRCPHANDHRNACTGSNEPGQEGSAYPAAPKPEAE